MFTLNKLTMAITAAGLGASLAMPAQASEQELLDVLLQNHIITADQHHQLSESYAKESASDIKISTKGGLKAQSNDGAFKFQVGGRIMADATFGSSDDASINDMNEGTEFRRARIFFKGQLNNDWGYKWQVDFADSDVSTKDMFIKYKPKGLTIGQFKQPFSLEELTSSKYITFMERGLPNVFATGRRIGVGYDSDWDGGTFAASVYGQEAGNGDENQEGFGA
ncbi:MAG: OprO/OprP family phosphate-selective porin, partial [Immundisolibacteraceae bacterium]|nr:OprO/OprP family phosphate-selective porin [Immundisolibacteraceae bacterium]